MLQQSQLKIETTSITEKQQLLKTKPCDFIKWLVDSSKYWEEIGFRPFPMLNMGEPNILICEGRANILIGERISDHLLRKLWNEWMKNDYNNMTSFDKRDIEGSECNGYKLKLLPTGDYQQFNEKIPNYNRGPLNLPNLYSQNQDSEQSFYLLTLKESSYSAGECLGHSNIINLSYVGSGSNHPGNMSFVKVYRGLDYDSCDINLQ
jgi:hypothetical protein